MAGKSPVRVVRDVLTEPGGFKSLRIRWIDKNGRVLKESIGDLSKADKKDLQIKGKKKTKKRKGLKIKDSEIG